MATEMNVEAEREAVARAICTACDEVPDHRGDARGNAFRWQDYLDVADAALAALRTSSVSIGEDGLPELPDGDEYSATRMLQNGQLAPRYTAATMRQYALDAVAAARVYQRKVDERIIERRDAEIVDLRTQLASAQQAKEYEQRHAAESEKALAQVHAQLARQRQGNRLLPREVFANDDAYSAYLQEWATPPLSSEQQAEVAPCEMPGCSGTGKASSVIQLCPEHTADFIDWRKQKELPCGS